MATSFHKVNNNAASTLNAAIDDNDLSLAVPTGEGAEFDTVAQYLTLGRSDTYNGEILDVASRSSDTFTVTTRGVDGTTATAHDAGDRVECLLVAAHITEIQDAINAIENGTVFLAQVKLGDDTGKLIFGADSDIQFLYDEATDDRLEITDGTNLLAYLKDLGSTGLFGVTGRIEAPQIGISADTDLLALASGALTVNGTIAAAADTDATFILGRGRFHSGVSDFILVSHYDVTSAQSYALGQGAVGQTLINAASGQTISVRINNTQVYSVAGTAQTFAEAYNLATGTTTGSKIGTGTTQKIGFWNATPIAQPSSTGETTGFTAGGGTNVTDASTFTGNVGSTAYRISDIVKHLKNIGLIAA